MSSDVFTVRRLRSADEVGAVISRRAAEMGWKPGALDHISYFAADETGFFVGERSGVVISCMSAVKYSDKYAFLGNYIVDEPYRGKGYGISLCTKILASLAEGCNSAADGVENMSPKYKGRYSYKSAWKNRRVNISASAGSLSLESISSLERVKIQPASKLQFGKLLDYDTSVHVYARSSFLEKWISAPNSYSYAATNDDGAVVGYTVVRRTLREEDGWRIGPLFADDSKIARLLYKAVLGQISAIDPTSMVTVDVPFGSGMTNPDAFQITKEILATPEFTTVRIYSNGTPSNLPLHKVFGLTSLELG